MKPLPREFYLRDTAGVARELLGKELVRNTKEGLLRLTITEVEAYLGREDPACHSYGGRRTPRTQVMYGPGGHAYLHLIYGMHFMLNVVTQEAEAPCAVLIRAGVPAEGLDLIAANRFGKPYRELTKSQVGSLCDGPGKVAKALALTKAQNGWDLCGGSELFLTQGRGSPLRLSPGPGSGWSTPGRLPGGL